jgi:hypothetical protein
MNDHILEKRKENFRKRKFLYLSTVDCVNILEARENRNLTLRKEQIDNFFLTKRLKSLNSRSKVLLEIIPDVLEVDHTMPVEPVSVVLNI